MKKIKEYSPYPKEVNHALILYENGYSTYFTLQITGISYRKYYRWLARYKKDYPKSGTNSTAKGL
ncbi:MAG: helix-turn-helix domain-containing protein [Patescibacteria group bacterium]